MENKEAERFEQQLIVQEDDIDELGHVNNVTYVQWVQNIAELHWKTRANKSHLHSCVWVVLNHFIEYKRPAFEGEQLRVVTFVGETESARSFRHVEIYRDQALIAKAKTEWCLLDAQTKKPKRITDELFSFFQS